MKRFEDRNWLARVWGPTGICGSAFAIDGRHLLTCAHVVLEAGGAGPGALVDVDFPQLGSDERCQAEVLANGWHMPAGNDATSGPDSAVLRLVREHPGVQALPLAARESCHGLTFAAYGFPLDRPDGDAAHGRLGLAVGQAWVRLESDGDAAIEPGFSGTAAWSPEIGAAVAVVVARRVGEQRVAYALPLSRLVTEIPPLAAALAVGPQPLAWVRHVPAGLQADLISFARLIEDRTTDFIGRDFVFDALADRMKSATCGYVFIRGEPGIGKSALMAQLARTRGWVHHFNVAPENQRSPARFLRNICAQLVLRYRLPLDALPEGEHVDARLLGQLLHEASGPADEPVVVLVDALDEAEAPPPGVNRLYLPRELPQRVFIVTTIRHHVDDGVDSPQRLDDILLDENGEGNRRDVVAYLHAFVQRQAHRRETLLAPWQGDERAFVEDAATRSEGNFMYLRHVLPLLAAGKLTYALPRGLVGYYNRHWHLMKSRQASRFARLHKPVLAYLAIAREAVCAEDIASWMKDGDPFEVQDLLAEWSEFLDEVPGPPPRWRLYHNSFLDFLDGKLSLARYRSHQAQVMEGKVDWGEAQ